MNLKKTRHDLSIPNNAIHDLDDDMIKSKSSKGRINLAYITNNTNVSYPF